MYLLKLQLARRNLSTQDRVKLALLLKPSIEEKAKEKQREAGGAVPQKSAKALIDTREEIAHLAGVSHDTVRKSETIEKEASPEIKEAVRKGEMSVNKAYRETKNPAPQKQNEGNF